MKTAPHPTETNAEVIVRDLEEGAAESLRAATLEKASRLFEYSVHLDDVRIEIGCDPDSTAERRFIAKAHLEFGGPALFTSVADPDAARATDYLFEKLHSQLRRQSSQLRPMPVTSKTSEARPRSSG